MKDLFGNLLSAQNAADGTEGGLPFWMFWLLLLVIALLLVFIFLRDKDLRRRLDAFFTGIKNRLRKVRLQTSLKKERQKHENLMLELGKTTWEEDVEVPSAQSLRDQLARLDKTRADLQDKRSTLDDKISGVNQEMTDFQKKQETAHIKLEAQMKPYADKFEEVKKQAKDVARDLSQKKSELDSASKEIASLQKDLAAFKDKGDMLEEVKKFELESLEEKAKNLEARKSEADQALAALGAKKSELDTELSSQQKDVETYQSKLKKNKDKTKAQCRKYQKDIREWEKQRDKVSESIQEMEQQKTPLLQNLGEHVNTDRVEHEELEILYSKIDRSKVKTQELEDQIDHLD